MTTDETTPDGEAGSNGPGKSPELYRGPVLATVQLRDALKTGSAGDTKTDADLKKVCDLDTSVKGPGYSNLMTAIRICERDHQVCWRRVHGAGYIECLSSLQKMDLASKGRTRVRRFGKRTGQVLNSVKLADLDLTDRNRHGALLAIYAVITHATAPQQMKRLIGNGAEAPDQRKMLALMLETARK